jgi:REP element-mobilizing transposase RayT
VRVHGVLRAKANELGCSEVVVGGMENHVHVFCRFPPVLSLSELVRQLKGASSHFASHQTSVKEFQWQGGYGAFTVDRTSVNRIRNYVLNQKQHHSEKRTDEDWETTWIDDD